MCGFKNKLYKCFHLLGIEHAGLTCNLLWLIILIENSVIFVLMQSRQYEFLYWKQLSQSKEILWIALTMNKTHGDIFDKSLSLYSSCNTRALRSRLLKWWWHFSSLSSLQLPFIAPCSEALLLFVSFISSLLGHTRNSK